MTNDENPFHAFLSYSHDDANWVENLAYRLEDQDGFKVWLDRWVLVPGKSWQQTKELSDDAKYPKTIRISELRIRAKGRGERNLPSADERWR